MCSIAWAFRINNMLLGLSSFRRPSQPTSSENSMELEARVMKALFGFNIVAKPLMNDLLKSDM